MSIPVITGVPLNATAAISKLGNHIFRALITELTWVKLGIQIAIPHILFGLDPLS